MKEVALNVFGKPLQVCGINPTTGYYRNGCCETGVYDEGTHTVCAIVTDTFLNFSKGKGNDLISAYPEFNFPGLVAGDHWCLCVSRWLEAYRFDKAPQIILEACHIKTLDYIEIGVLKKFAFELT